MLYSDHYRIFPAEGGGTECRRHPLIDCQPGSVRDDFDFGPLVLLRTDSFREAVSGMTGEYGYAGFYDLRLRMRNIVHINEFLYTDVAADLRRSGQRQFDYVDPKNRAVQMEMEAVCTDYLKRIGAYLPPVFREPDFSEYHNESMSEVPETGTVTMSSRFPVLLPGASAPHSLKYSASSEMTAPPSRWPPLHITSLQAITGLARPILRHPGRTAPLGRPPRSPGCPLGWR